jgi:C4-dicarboxylate-specific signal transduction histidine kinase
LRSRTRQYQIRDQIRQATLAQDALIKSEKLAVTGRLAASIAHEINNPLEGVINLLYLMRSENSVEQMRAYALQAEQELARVSEITKHTLRFYREPSSSVEIEVLAVIESVLAIYHSRLMAASVDVKLEVRCSSAIIRASPGELRQILANLIGNALDAMRLGGTLRIRLSSHPFRLTKGQLIRLTIADTGTGIPKNMMSSIFEPFITSKGETGTGLGLWVASELAKKNHWTIQVRSRFGEACPGTVFSIVMAVGQRTQLHNHRRT